jgi:hypothetical protein
MNDKVLEAQSRLNKAQEDEVKAQESGNPVAINEAKGRKVEAADALYAARQPEPEETVTLLSPNSAASGKDSAGLEWHQGKAEGVPRSLAERLAAEFPGYQIRE